MALGKLAYLRNAVGDRAADGVKTAECHSRIHSALDFLDNAAELLHALGGLGVEVDVT